MLRPLRLVALVVAACAALPAVTAVQAQAQTKTVHALSLVGEPKYGPDFKQFSYVNPDAPKGGELRQYGLGGFDSFNPFIVKGQPPVGIGLVFQTLLARAPDDPPAAYASVAESIEVPDDIAWVAFTINPKAKWHDGKPITAEDVVWSFNILREKGSPEYRAYYAAVDKAEAVGPKKVKFTFKGPKNRELPQIMGDLPVLPKHWWAGKAFDQTSLEPPLGSGPYKVGSFEAGRTVTYERVTDWWAKDLPIHRGRFNFDRLRYDMYRDTTVALEAFKAGQYDMRIETSAKEWATGYDFPAVKDGRVQRAKLPDASRSVMQAFVYNIRRPKFADPRVRQALAYAFDYEWSNKTLFYGEYVRTDSYFENSPDLQAEGTPSPEELKLLEPLRDKLPPEVFTKRYEPPKTDGSGNLRDNLRLAAGLLKQAGYTVKDQKLVGPDGQPFTFELLLNDAVFERIAQPFLRNLERLGIQGTIRTVDPAQYINRRNNFDYDMVVELWGQSDSPGNEQRDFWGSAAADRPGSRNYIGIKNPAIDQLIEDLVAAHDRAGVVTATHALDRALLWNHYVIPMWHGPFDRVAWWDRFGIPPKPTGYGAEPTAWWFDAGKAKRLNPSSAAAR